MIQLNFKIDKKVLDEDKKYFNEEKDFVPLGISFMMPVSLCVDGVEIFQFRDGEPVSIALLDIATEGLATVENLNDGEEKRYDALEDAGSYYFKRLGDKVYIRTNMNFNTAVAPYRELLHSFKIFANKVRAFFIRELPVILDDENWGDWIKGNDDA